MKNKVSSQKAGLQKKSYNLRPTTYNLFSIGCCFAIALLFGGCIESSPKYKQLLANRDSLQQIQDNGQQEMELLLTGINELAAGMQSLREAENMLALTASENQNSSSSAQARLRSIKNDINSIQIAINGYKEQIVRLENSNARQSTQFKQLIATLEEELALREERIADLTTRLSEREKEVGFKSQQVEALSQNVEDMQEESIRQQEVIAKQDSHLHLGHYLLGSRKSLREADIISRRGIFCPPVVSSQAQKADFVAIDIREVNSLPLQSKKARLLSAHPADSYRMVQGEDGMQTLEITNSQDFWRQTRYLVVMINE